MKRQLNFRFLGILLAVLAVVAVAAHKLHAHQLKQNAGYLLKRSHDAQAGQKPDVTTAVKYLLHYLTLRTDDAQARARLGVILARDAKGMKAKQEAYLTIGRALRDDPDVERALRENSEVTRECDAKESDPYLASISADLLKVRMRAAELAMDLYEFTDARDHLTIMLAENPTDGQLLFLIGRCEDEGGRPEQAREYYEKASVAAPSHVESYSRLADLLLRTGQSAEADQVMERLIQRNPDSARARLAVVRHYRMGGQLTAARQHLSAMKSGSSREDKDLLLATADLALAERNEPAAREALEAGLAKFQDEPQFFYMMADLEFRAGRKTEARNLLRTAMANAGKQPDVLWVIADLLISAEETAEARQLITRLREASAEQAAVDLLEARILLGDRQPVKAETLLLRCRSGFGRNPLLAMKAELLLVECYARTGRHDLRLKSAEQAIQIDPASGEARLAHAAALYAAGKWDEARQVYQSLTSREGYGYVVLAVVQIEVLKNRLKPVAQRDLSTAETALKKIPQTHRDAPEYQLAMAEVLVTEGTQKKLEEARRLMEAARDKDPKDTRFWVFLAATAGDPEKGLAILDEAANAAGDQVPLRLVRAALLVRQKADAATLRNLEAANEKFSSADRLNLFTGLAATYLRAGSPDDAERLLRQTVAENPDDPAPMFQLFEVILAKATAADMTDWTAKLKTAEGDEGSVWRFADAYRGWLEYKNDKNPDSLRHARIRLSEAEKRRPNWYWVPLLSAQIEDLLGQTDAAIAFYSRAIQLGANRPEVVGRAASLLWGRRRYDEARHLIEDLRRRSPILPPNLSRLETLTTAQLAESPDELADRVAKSVKADSPEYRDHLLRASIYTSLQRQKEAEEAYRRAAELSPKTPETWVGLVTFLVRAERKAEARAELEKAIQALPANLQAQALAPCREALGERAEAEKLYLQVCRESGESVESLRGLANFYLSGGDTGKAEAVLRRLVDANPTVRRWAQRTLALTIAANGNYSRGGEALELLESNLRETPNDPEALRTRSLILATRSGGRRQAIQNLEAAFISMPASPAEAFLLARLYEVDGDWAKASDRMLELLSSRGGNNPTYLYAYVRGLLRHNDLPGAEKWLARLKALEKEAPGPRTIELEARVDVARGRTAQAAARLTQFARDAYSADKNPEILRPVGVILAELKLLDAAEQLLRQYAAAVELKTPAAVLILADFLSRHRNKVGEALGICEAALDRADPEAIARAAVAAVRLGDASAADFTRAEEIIRKGAKAKPSSTDILISLADLRDARGLYAEAEQMYRDILKVAPRSVLAMNNLAWLLALHAGKGDEALELVNRAITIQGPDGNLLDTRGVIFLAAKDPRQAVADLVAATAQESTPERFFHLAEAYDRQGNDGEARRAMRKALELNLSRKDLHRLELPGYESMLAKLDANR